MKITKVLFLLVAVIFTACSGDDDSGTSPKKVNIKFEATSDFSELYARTRVIIDNDSIHGGEMPYAHTVAQREVSSGTFLKLDLLDNWTWDDDNYPINVDLKIYENNTVIAQKSVTLTQDNQLNYLEYTYD